MTVDPNSSRQTSIAQISAQKRRVAQQSMIAAGIMTVLKLVAGLMSGSLGVLSDAAHSALDLIGVTLTFFSVQLSDKPADEDHTYGHGKFENLSAFGEAGLMALSCAWIVWEAMQRIVHQRVELHHSLWPVLVLLTSIAVDAWRSRELRAVAERTGSQALAVDAFHFASDIWSTVAVLGGLAASWIGMRLGIGWLRFADPFAAVVVSLMILRMTLYLGRETVAVLLDEVPAETRQRLVDEVANVLRRFNAGAATARHVRTHRRIGARRNGGSSSRAAPSRCGDPYRSPRDARGEHLRPRASCGGTQQRQRARAQRAVASRTPARGTAR